MLKKTPRRILLIWGVVPGVRGGGRTCRTVASASSFAFCCSAWQRRRGVKGANSAQPVSCQSPRPQNTHTHNINTQALGSAWRWLSHLYRQLDGLDPLLLLPGLGQQSVELPDMGSVLRAGHQQHLPLALRLGILKLVQPAALP